MLQYAVPNAPQPFQRPPSVFADPPHRSSNTGQQNAQHISQQPTADHTPSEYYHNRSFSSTADSNASGTGLTALASLAANAPAAAVNPASNSGDRYETQSPPKHMCIFSSPLRPNQLHPCIDASRCSLSFGQSDLPAPDQRPWILTLVPAQYSLLNSQQPFCHHGVAVSCHGGRQRAAGE